MGQSLKEINAQLEKLIKTKNDIVEKQNAAFNRLTTLQKRVAIAKDAIAQIQSGKYKPTTGKYIELNNSLKILGSGSKSLQDAFLNATKCQVCARGALFVSQICKGNKCSLSDIGLHESDRYINLYNFKDHESKIWDEETIYLIESCFEKREMCEESSVAYSDIEAAIHYGKSFKSAKDRLVGICQNIIDNKGKFIIPKKFYPCEDIDS